MIAASQPTGSAAPPRGTGAERVEGRLELGAPALLVVGWAFLLPIVFAPQVFGWFFTPKAALALVALGPGLVVALRLAIARDLAARLALMFLGIATLAMLGSDEPVMSLLGSYLWGNGLLFVALLVGAWALGRTLAAPGRDLLGVALVGAALVNAAIGWLQLSTDLGPDWAQPFEARAVGLMGNPVQLGALCAGALALAAARARVTSRPAAWLAAIVLLAGAVELSGSRVAVVGGLAGVVVAVLVAPRMCTSDPDSSVQRGRRRALVVLAAVAVGATLAVVLPARSVDAGSDRIGADATAGLGPRVGSWLDAVDGLRERPLLGYGPGRYFAATAPRTSLAVARYGDGDTLYADAHNVVVETVTTTGVLGLLAFVAWLVVALRRASGPLLLFAGVVALSMLLEPEWLGLTPLVLLAVGASAPEIRLGPSRSATVAVALSALVGCVAAAWLLVGDVTFARGVQRASATELQRSVERMPPWPEPVAALARVHALRAGPEGARASRTLALNEQRDAIDRDPADPKWWLLLGEMQEVWGDESGAERSYHAALDRNPWSVRAMAGVYRTARARGDLDTARAMRDRLCRYSDATCIPKADLEDGADR